MYGPDKNPIEFMEIVPRRGLILTTNNTTNTLTVWSLLTKSVETLIPLEFR